MFVLVDSLGNILNLPGGGVSSSPIDFTTLMNPDTFLTSDGAPPNYVLTEDGQYFVIL